jgi:hypothetical protein
MSTVNKVLVGLIIVALLPFFYLAARTLKTHKSWRDLVRKHESEIRQLQKDNERLMEGAPGELGIRQLRVELHRFAVQRGRVWHNCDAKVVKVSKENGEAEIRVPETENAATLADKGKIVVYAFEEADIKDKGRYLGEFSVTPGDKQVTLQPVHKLSARECDRLSSSKGPWALYEEMPGDHHDVFAKVSDEEKKALFPADTVAEFLKHGKPAAQDDPQERVIEGNYVRALRSYKTLFNIDRKILTEMIDLTDAVHRDKALLDTALAAAKRQEEASKKQLAEWKKRLAKFERERDIVENYRQKLEKGVAAATARVKQLLETNKAMAGQLAQAQWDAARSIDQRSRAMAKSETGSK